MGICNQALSAKTDALDQPAAFTLNSYISADPDEHACHLAGWEQTYDQLTAGKFSGELVDCWFKDLQMFREITTQAVQQVGRSWERSRSFLIPFSMDGVARWGANETEVMDLSNPTTLSGSEELDFRTPSQLDLLVVSIDADALSEFSIVMDGFDIEEKLKGQGRLSCEEKRLKELRALLDTMFATLTSTPNVLRYESTQKLIRHSLMTAILQTFSGDSSGAQIRPAGRRAASHHRTVRRAREYVLENTYNPVTVAELCSVLAVSRRTLQSCFQEVIGTNPVQYLRSVRLNKVRRELRTANRDKTKVQDVAARWGFWHLGHFTTEYRQMFGERPSDTLRRSLAG